MTVEVGILNKHGVALAADSAVTIGNGRGYYNTANKLFALSKYSPVAIMVYSNAEFMGCPIEIIVKEFRKEIKDESLPRLRDYWDRFTNFLRDFVIKNNIDQKERIMDEIADFLTNVDFSIKYNIEEFIDNVPEEYTKEEIESEMNLIMQKTIKDTLVGLNGFADDNIFLEILDDIKVEINDEIKDKIDLIIGENLDSELVDILLEASYKLITKKIIYPSYTGIVIAGYGENEIYPTIIYGKFMGCFFDRLKVAAEENDNIDVNNRAVVIPFAQDDVINTFMNGMDGAFIEEIERVIQSNKRINEFGEGSKETKENLIKEISNKFREFSHKNHWGPMIATVSAAPKEELAQMAETLVNLTSFRRKMNMDEYSQTVGGPIDVLTITKGDGLIWIKRKNYFDKNLNHQFFNNYNK